MDVTLIRITRERWTYVSSTICRLDSLDTTLEGCPVSNLLMLG